MYASAQLGDCPSFTGRKLEELSYIVPVPKLAQGITMARKNILLLIADDLGTSLGCYGASTIQTPNIDRLAEDGTRFTMAFTSTASCSASRSVIYTGLHTHENGMYGLHNGRNHFTTFDYVETAPKLFNDIGYETGIIGKVHVGPVNVYPWQVRQESGTRDVAWVADRASEFFESAKSSQKPFMLTVGYIDPHRDLTRSGFGNDNKFDTRVQTNEYAPKDVEVPEFLSDLDEVRTELAEYYQSINRLDQGVGLILAALEKSGFKDDTLVVFMSDNGPPFLNSKTTLYDAGVRLPLIIKQPVDSAHGTVNPNMVSYIDILPTLLDWAGHKEMKGVRLGRSILPILRESIPLDDWGRVFGSHTFHEITNYWPTRFMRTRKYKYHRNIAWRLDFPFAADLYGSLTWEGVRNKEPPMLGGRSLKSYIFRPPEELYDLESDPREINNLAVDEAHTERLKEFRTALEEWQRVTGDPWLYRDGVSVRFVKHHIDAGLKVPDRFDLDIENPGNKSHPCLEQSAFDGIK